MLPQGLEHLLTDNHLVSTRVDASSSRMIGVPRALVLWPGFVATCSGSCGICRFLVLKPAEKKERNLLRLSVSKIVKSFALRRSLAVASRRVGTTTSPAPGASSARITLRVRRVLLDLGANERPLAQRMSYK